MEVRRILVPRHEEQEFPGVTRSVSWWMPFSPFGAVIHEAYISEGTNGAFVGDRSCGVRARVPSSRPRHMTS